MTSLPAGLQDLVEAVCSEGCNHVRSIIRQFEDGRDPEELRHLTPDERRLVLQELRAIMAVYDAH